MQNSKTANVNDGGDDSCPSTLWVPQTLQIFLSPPLPARHPWASRCTTEFSVLLSQCCPDAAQPTLNPIPKSRPAESTAVPQTSNVDSILPSCAIAWCLRRMPESSRGSQWLSVCLENATPSSLVSPDQPLLRLWPKNTTNRPSD